jgi:ribonuclease Z
MSIRELVVLGTASQVPTRDRAHNGAVLRFDDEVVLLDPGEGTQRQLTFAGIAASDLTRVCITHVHGDHCLGLPGVVQRCSLDGRVASLPIHFPEEATATVRGLCEATPFQQITPIDLRPERPGAVDTSGVLRVRAAALSHRLPTLGWRFDEPDRWRLRPELASAAGVEGRARRELLEVGHVRAGGRHVRVEEVAVPRPGQSVAFVMDTRWCDGALELADGVDLLVVEATFLESERDLAEEAGHLTAAQAARLGQEAGARRVVLTHLSQRYLDLDGHREEARLAAPDLDVHIAADLDRIPFPPRGDADG